MKQLSLYSIAQMLYQRELFAFTSRTLADLPNLNKVQAAQLLGRMEAEGFVARVERGKYLLLGLSPERILSNPFYVGNHLVTPSYVSFWSALHFHGMTEQAPRTVFLATTRKKPEMKFQEMTFKFVTLQPKAFFGYRREIIADLPVLIADEPKAILDSLLFPQYAGGISEAAKALSSAIEQNEETAFIQTLVEYSNRLENLSLGSRLGYLLDILSQSVEGLQISRGPVVLDMQTPRGGAFNKRWNVYINVSPQNLFPEGVA